MIIESYLCSYETFYDFKPIYFAAIPILKFKIKLHG